MIDVKDQEAVNNFWDKQTDIAHDCINDVVKHAQDHAYDAGFKRAMVRADRLQAIGAKLANCAFNLAQKTGVPLKEDETALLNLLRKEWDEAVQG